MRCAVQSFNSGGKFKGSRAACLKCDLWSLGVICVCLFLGETVFQSSNYSTVLRNSNQDERSNRTRALPCTARQYSSRRSFLSVVQAVTASIPTLGPFFASCCNRGEHSGQASAADDSQDANVSDWEEFFMEAAVKDQVKALVEQQLTILSRSGGSPDLLVLVRGLLEPDPDRRLTTSDALASPVFRKFIRMETAIQSTVSARSTSAPKSQVPTPGLQLWGVVRQSRPQLAEMARRETLVTTLADRRDALERLADLVHATLAGEAKNVEMVIPDARAGQLGEDGAARSGVKANLRGTGLYMNTSKLTQQTLSLRGGSGPCRGTSQEGATVTAPQAGADTSGVKLTSDLVAYPVDYRSSVIQVDHNTTFRGEKGQARDSLSARKMSGRVRFSGVGEAVSTTECVSFMLQQSGAAWTSSGEN